METIKATNQEALDAWDALSQLSKNADIPDFKARYAIARSFDKLKSAVDPLFEEKNSIIKKYHVLEKNQVRELKEGMNADDFEKEVQEFFKQEIEIEVYKIKMSTLVSGQVFNERRERVSLPANFLIVLDKWLIDDMQESENDPAPDISPKKSE